MYISYALRQPMNDISSVVALVNKGTAEGIEGIEFTSAQLAGQYAYDAAEEAGYGIDEDSIDAQLDALSAAGATFGWSSAIDHALLIAQAAAQ